MSTPAAVSLEWLLRPLPSDPGIDRKALAGLLAELARNVEPTAYAEANGVARVDPRLEQLRTLLVGHEIEVLARLRGVVEDPEQLAMAVGQVLPAAIAAGSDGSRLGQTLAPALEKAIQASIRTDPRTLVDILHPLIVPAIRQSIGEAIDKTLQSLNEALKHSLSWRGLRWRWEAWRTGSSFAEIVLRHTLVYRVEHVFLIHHHTGLLIAHVAAEDAASQDPQLVSSMLVAIQDFIRDSFTGAEHHGIDTLRLGELWLWSEPGSFATLVAVIRGNPPEELRDVLRNALARIHQERYQALESFDGDSSGLADVDAHLAECAALRQQAPQSSRGGFPWAVAVAALALFVLAAAGGLHWWQSERLRAGEQHLWADYIARLRAQPGVIVTDAEHRDGRFVVAGLRDPLAADPQSMLRQSGLDPRLVVSHWAPYEGLDPAFVLKRLRASLDPPPTVTLAVSGNDIVAHGSASSPWLERARAVARTLPAGSPSLDLSQVRNANEGAFAKLRAAIESHKIHFSTDDSLPAPGQEAILDTVAKELKELGSLASTMRVAARVTLNGHSDDTGRGTFNLSLSLARADAVLALLTKRGVDPSMLAARGAGPLEPLQEGDTEGARSANRRVSFTVWFEQ